MTLCDMCRKEKKCRSREIEGKEYDICSECWTPIAKKLKGKGRAIQETVFLPPPAIQAPEPKEPQPVPGEPPKIWDRARTIH